MFVPPERPNLRLADEGDEGALGCPGQHGRQERLERGPIIVGCAGEWRGGFGARHGRRSSWHTAHPCVGRFEAPEIARSALQSVSIEAPAPVWIGHDERAVSGSLPDLRDGVSVDPLVERRVVEGRRHEDSKRMPEAVMDLVIAGNRGLELTLPDRHAITALIAARDVTQTAEQIA